MGDRVKLFDFEKRPSVSRLTPKFTPAGSNLPDPIMFDLMILGSGMAGLAAAQCAQNDGKQVLLVDKGRRLGGRVATRRKDGFVFNHGAQFVTAKGTVFASLLGRAQQLGCLTDWQISPDKTVQIGAPTMRDLAQFIAKDLNIHQQTEITSIAHHGDGIGFFDMDGLVACGRQAIVTAPAPQSARLLAALYPGLAATASLAAYDPCWTIMLGLENDDGIAPMPLRDEAAGIQFAALETSRQKPQSIAANQIRPAMTIQASGAWSQQHLEDDPQEVIEKLTAIWQDITGHRLGNILNAAAHRWRYAKVSRATPETAARLSDDQKLAIAGDWLGGPRIEQAFDSGQQAYYALKASLEARHAR